MKNIFKGKDGKIDKKRIIICAVVALIVLGILIYLIVDHIHDKKILEKSSIDFNSETYKGKKIEVKGNQIIIHEENGSKTIETVNPNQKEMTKATQKIRNAFEIKDINVTKQAAKTTITGVLKAKTNDYKTAVVSAKFYRNDVLAATSSASIKEIKKNDNNSFTIEFVGDYSDCTHTIEVEYVE